MINMMYLPIESPVRAIQSKVGRIVVSADDMITSDRYWSSNTEKFTLNVFNWLTEFSPGKQILSDTYSKLPVETSSEDAFLAWNQGRRFVLPVTKNFHSGIVSIPPQGECPI